MPASNNLGRAASWPLLRVLLASSGVLSSQGRPIDIFCHSLGSVVVIRALAIAAKHRFSFLRSTDRVIFRGGSEYSGEAQLMYSRIGEAVRRGRWNDAQGPQFHNIVSPENDILDTFTENFGPQRFFSNTQVVGHNGLQAREGAERRIDFQIDGACLADRLREQFKVKVSGDNPGEIWDHWYYYTHWGNMELYRRILRELEDRSIPAVREHDPKCPKSISLGWFGD